jgi:hypothetical protein
MAFHRTTGCLATLIVTMSAAADRTVVRNIQIVSFDQAMPFELQSNRTIIIDDGIITAIKPPSDEDLRAGDMLVDGGGAFALPGFIEVIVGPALTFSDLTRFPLIGVTTVIGDFDATRLRWYARLDREAAIHGPSLAPRSPAVDATESSGAKPWERVWSGHWRTAGEGDRPAELPEPDHRIVAEVLREKSVATARRHGLSDRGAIAVGQRGDLVIVAKHPGDHPETLMEPIEVLIGGRTMRRSALETNRSMIAEADAAIAARPAPGADRWRFLIESSGLRVGELLVTADGRSGEEWWGPPIRQTTTWSWASPAVPPESKPTESSGWELDLVERAEHGFTIAMRVARGSARTVVTARMTAPESRPPQSAEIDATPQAPILDPVSLVLAHRETLVNLLPEGKATVIEVLEPNPEAGSVKFGIRNVVIRRLPTNDPPVPVGPGELLWQIEEEPRKGADPPAHGAISGWVVADATGAVLRASMVAPEGITEYFRSLPQPSSGSAPETKPK